MSDGLERSWRVYLDDMSDFARDVLAYTAGVVQDDFLRNKLVYDATLRKLELIGEAATHIPAEVRGQTSAIPWRQIIATRNRLIHGYLGIDNDTVWSIIRDDIPALLDQIESIRLAAQAGRFPDFPMCEDSPDAPGDDVPRLGLNL